MLNLIIFSLILIALGIASYTDIKTREVPDWLNYSLIFSGIGLRLLFSLATNNWLIFLEGVLGFIIFFAMSLGMFYAGQWGGGDSKMLMGLGALLGFEASFSGLLITFIINLIIAGSLYGLAWSLFLAIKNKNSFLAEFRTINNKNKKIRNSFILLGVISAVSALFINDLFFNLLLISLPILLLSTLYFWMFLKSVETSCMFKFVHPKELTEGDWIPHDIKVSGKYIAGPKDLGITRKQIASLIRLNKQNKIKNVLMKTGIPFIPSFLIAFILTLVTGNMLLLIVS